MYSVADSVEDFSTKAPWAQRTLSQKVFKRSLEGFLKTYLIEDLGCVWLLL